ncbi:hypothetical protein CERZMDRAFT_87285 [Cercospora zeae-maydis SCOH1-5]|uniref:Uncharacterized protein n=1 Tax=Cercospora zeae-maydis SCOH1-5 TaxID=717836 RepID=A0A6A6F3R5_9PEZI|nr:hypothetical protein CERZMDRAFT_87285 [Cercospora zeae-maydis SCOH1-5]
MASTAARSDDDEITDNILAKSGESGGANSGPITRREDAHQSREEIPQLKHRFEEGSIAAAFTVGVVASETVHLRRRRDDAVGRRSRVTGHLARTYMCLRRACQKVKAASSLSLIMGTSCVYKESRSMPPSQRDKPDTTSRVTTDCPRSNPTSCSRSHDESASPTRRGRRAGTVIPVRCDRPGTVEPKRRSWHVNCMCNGLTNQTSRDVRLPNGTRMSAGRCTQSALASPEFSGSLTSLL